MPLDVLVGQPPPAALPGHLAGPLPAVGVGETHHPRKRRRLVRTLKIVGAMIRSRCASASRVVQQDHVLGGPGVGVAQVGLDPGLPVGVPHRGGAAGEHELAGDEVVVGDGVGGEMAEVAEAEGAHRVGCRRGRGSPGPRASSGSAGPVARSASRSTSRPRCCRRENRRDTRGAGRRPRRAATAGWPAPTRRDRCACRASRRAPSPAAPAARAPRRPTRARGAQDHRRLGTRSRRTRPSMPFPWRTVRSAAATSRAVSSTSSCTTVVERLEIGQLGLDLSTPRTTLRRIRRPVWANAPASLPHQHHQVLGLLGQPARALSVWATSSCSPSTIAADLPGLPGRGEAPPRRQATRQPSTPARSRPVISRSSARPMPGWRRPAESRV